MAVRAMWKGVIRFGEIRVPVKLYAAIEDRNVHFRLLHRKDGQPVSQHLVNPETERTVAFAETGRAYVTETGDMVLLGQQELAELEPQPSRDIEILAFLPPSQIDHRWYDRPYFLGPDESSEEYFALADALESSGLVGLAHWVMRKKEYLGGLQLYQGYPMLMSLRSAQEVISVSALEPPGGPALDQRELAMARRLIGMLEAKFEPQEYSDEYRNKVLELVQAKAKGKKPKLVAERPRETAEDVGRALEASLNQARKRA